MSKILNGFLKHLMAKAKKTGLIYMCLMHIVLSSAPVTVSESLQIVGGKYV